MIRLVVLGCLVAAAAAFKDSMNVTCKMENGQVFVDIFPKRAIYDVQLKNADQACDPQEFTAASIRFVIPHFQLGICGFARADSSTDGLDGTFWNNIIWKEKPTSTKTQTTKVKCVQKLSTILNSQHAAMPMPMSVHVIRLPFGAFPSAFNTDAAETSPDASAAASMSGLSALMSGLGMGMGGGGGMGTFPAGLPPGLGGLGSGMVWLRSGNTSPFGNQPVITKK